jgi:hypothetical protein
MTTNEPLLLNEVLPHYDVSAKYETMVRATPARIYRVMQGGFPAGAITKLLMALRSVPRYFQRKAEDDPPGEESFYKLKQLENREIVVGIIGQFWKPVATWVPIHSLEEFMDFQKDGFCKAAMNFVIQEKSPGQCKVITETRVLAYGSAKRPFREYWRVIGPFSGLIRKEFLRKIKQKAEKRNY